MRMCECCGAGGQMRTWTRLIPLSVFVWWFAVLSPNGEIVYSNHRDKATCETTRKAYARVRSLTVTTCQTLNQSEEENHGWKS